MRLSIVYNVTGWPQNLLSHSGVQIFYHGICSIHWDEILWIKEREQMYAEKVDAFIINDNFDNLTIIFVIKSW